MSTRPANKDGGRQPARVITELRAQARTMATSAALMRRAPTGSKLPSPRR